MSNSQLSEGYLNKNHGIERINQYTLQFKSIQLQDDVKITVIISPAYQDIKLLKLALSVGQVN